MKIPKELTTITSLSKILAAILFISLPIIGFFLGMRYQEMMDLAKTQEMEQSLSITRAPTPTPIALPTVDPSITANWKTYTYSSTESAILPNMTFKYPSLFGNNPSLISSRNTNRPENISEDWGGFFEFNPTGAFGDRGLRIEFFKRVNSESSFESYVSKSATSGDWGSPKYLQVGNYKAARIRFSLPSHYDADVGWYFVELSNKSILEISTSGDKKFLYDDDQDGNSTRDQIISTFKFTDQTQAIPMEIVEGAFCGGIAGIQCSSGYRCQLDKAPPGGVLNDAGGICVKL